MRRKFGGQSEKERRMSASDCRDFFFTPPPVLISWCNSDISPFLFFIFPCHHCLRVLEQSEQRWVNIPQFDSTIRLLRRPRFRRCFHAEGKKKIKKSNNKTKQKRTRLIRAQGEIISIMMCLLSQVPTPPLSQCKWVSDGFISWETFSLPSF